MSDERTTNEDLRDLIDRNHDDSTRQFRSLSSRVSALESRYPGHSDSEIIDMIDRQLQASLPGIIEGAVGHALEAPLSRVDESIEASRNNRDAIDRVQKDLEPLVEIRQGMRFMKSFLLMSAAVTTAVAVIWAAVNGVFT